MTKMRRDDVPSLVQVSVLLERGMDGVMDAEVRGADAGIEFVLADSQYDGHDEYDALIWGKGEYRIKEWCSAADGYAWGHWHPIPSK